MGYRRVEWEGIKANDLIGTAANVGKGEETRL